MVKKYLGLSGPKLEDYLRMNFYDLWQQYDVIGNNQVEVEQMASFMKKLLHDQTIQIQWAPNY